MPAVRRGLLVVVSGMACAFFLVAAVRRYLPRIPYFKHMILTTSVGGSDAAMAGSLSNIDPLGLSLAVGSSGIALTDLKPGGSVQFKDAAGGTHVVAVISDKGYVARGTAVVVREAAGNRIVVRPADIV